MTRADFARWLDTVTVTKPFTIADAAELHGMIKAMLPNAYVDVYWTRGDKVHVRVDNAPVRDLELV